MLASQSETWSMEMDFGLDPFEGFSAVTISHVFEIYCNVMDFRFRFRVCLRPRGDQLPFYDVKV
jgi:hypothetical protein